MHGTNSTHANKQQQSNDSPSYTELLAELFSSLLGTHPHGLLAASSGHHREAGPGDTLGNAPPEAWQLKEGSVAELSP